MIDDGQADDKIVAVLEGDVTFGKIEDLGELPRPVVERLEHYFLTYKLAIDTGALATGTRAAPVAARQTEVEIAGVFGRDEAREVIERGLTDYRESFPDLQEQILATLRGTV